MLSRVLQLPFVLILDMNTETEDDKGEQRAARLHIVIIDNLQLSVCSFYQTYYCNETAVLFLAFIQHRRIREETEC